MRLDGKCDAGREVARELCGISISAPVGDVFEQPVIADAIQGKMWMAEMLIKRIVGLSERLANVVFGGHSHSLNPERSERRTRNRTGRSHVNRDRKTVADFDWQPHMQRDSQAVAVIELSQALRAYHGYARRAKLVLHHVGPNVIKFAEFDVPGCPCFKSRRHSHDDAHELVTAVVALAQIDALVGFGRLLALVPKRKSAAENGCRVRLFRFVTHHFPTRLWPNSFLE